MISREKGMNNSFLIRYKPEISHGDNLLNTISWKERKNTRKKNSSSKKNNVTWTFERDLLLAREILIGRPYRFKKGTKESCRFAMLFTYFVVTRALWN